MEMISSFVLKSSKFFAIKSFETCGYFWILVPYCIAFLWFMIIYYVNLRSCSLILIIFQLVGEKDSDVRTLETAYLGVQTETDANSQEGGQQSFLSYLQDHATSGGKHWSTSCSSCLFCHVSSVNFVNLKSLDSSIAR